MAFNFQELTENLSRVHNSKIALRNVAFCDGWPLFEATKNPLFNKHLMWSQPKEDQQTLDRIDLIMDAVERGKMSAVSAVLKTTGEWVGLLRFQPHESGDDSLEMGYWSHDKFWDGKLSLEVGNMCVDAAFRHSDVNRIVGASSPENRASCIGLQRGGGKPGKMVTRVTEDKKVLELKEFSVTREQWVKRMPISIRELLSHSKRMQDSDLLAHCKRSEIAELSEVC